MIGAFWNNRDRMIIFGIILYSLSYAVLSAFPQAIFNLYPYFMAVALIIIVTGIFCNPRFTKLYYYDSLNFLLFFYLFLCIVMIARGYDLRERSSSITMYEWIRTIFFDKYYVLWTFLPILAMFTSKNIKFKHLLNLAAISCIFSVIATLFNIPSVKRFIAVSYNFIDENAMTALLRCSYIWIFDIFAFFLLVGDIITNKKIVWILYITFFVSFIFKIIMARRGDSTMMLILFFFSLISYMTSHKVKKIKILILLLVFIFIAILILNTNLSDLLFYRGTMDTRSSIDIAVFDSLSPFEWVVGGGLNGRYLSPFYGYEEFQGYRYISETGFSFLVMKGGFLMAVTYILLWLIPALMGIFSSRNSLCKSIGLYLIWNVIYLYPSGLPIFSFQHYFAWFLAGLVSMPSVRRYSDLQIKYIFFK